MLNLGYFGVSSTREMSCMEYLDPRIRRWMRLTRASPESGSSKAHLGMNPQSMTQKTRASNSGAYSGPKGQLMKTESAKLGERVGNSGQLAFLLRDPRRVEVTGPETWKLIAPRPEAVFFAFMVLPGTTLIEPDFSREW